MVVTGDSDAPLVGGMDGWTISTFGLLTLLVGSGLFAIATWRTRHLLLDGLPARWAMRE